MMEYSPINSPRGQCWPTYRVSNAARLNAAPRRTTTSQAGSAHQTPIGALTLRSLEVCCWGLDNLAVGGYVVLVWRPIMGCGIHRIGFGPWPRWPAHSARQGNL